MTPLRLAGALGAALLLVAGCGSDGDGSVADDADTSISAAGDTDVETSSDADCPPVDGAGAQTREFDSAPPMCLEPGASYEAVVTTNMGEFTIAVDPDTAPVAANNFVFLARNQYFDDTVCHRIIPNFVVQCGDPTATGTGGPGLHDRRRASHRALRDRLDRHGQDRRPRQRRQPVLRHHRLGRRVAAPRVRTVRSGRRRIRHRRRARWPPPAHRPVNRANRSRSRSIRIVQR